MAVLYLLGLFLVVGLAQCEPAEPEIAYIEDSLRGSRIIDGWVAVNGQFPHTVNIRSVGDTGLVSACTGSILTNVWILTAAHCLARRYTHIVRLGDVDISTPGYMLESQERYIHHGYDLEETSVQTDDIAVLKLDRYIPYNDYIQPIRLQSSQRNSMEYTLMQLVQSGYGRTDDWWAPGSIVPDNLRWTYQRGLSMLVCRSWYPHSQVIDDRKTICAQFYNDTRQNPCTGDSGGALTIEDIDGKPTQIGIMSFGSARGCSSHNPSGHVRPEYYHSWLEEVTGISFDWNVEDLEASIAGGDQNEQIQVVE
ncbi:collagenase [Spodoptera frugiperda]|uniref:Collagenase n=1 Tax=Spodoptera frugiperda TaxID=7108 RepID=A0A9R0DD12_SPOFR|nr:collagenase [Spodoptera frugiperda]